MPVTPILANLANQNPNIQSISELINASIYDDENLQSIISVKKVKQGSPIAVVGEMGDVGTAGAGCNPTYTAVTIENSLRRWSLGDWDIAKKICYTELENTYADLTLNGGTEIAEVDEFVERIVEPRLERAYNRMLWRIAWFGDTAADVIANGGVLTAGTDKTLFTVEDGLWKRIFTQGTANASQVTAIAANSQTTYAAQKEAILTQGVATSLIDTILMDADSRILNSGALYLTKSLADALTADIKKVYKTNMPWETIFEGVRVAEYDGYKVYSISIWDRIIKTYENTGKALNKPYRAVLGNADEFLVGTDTGGLFNNIDIFFDKVSRQEHIYAQGKIGTQLREVDMFHAAY